MKKEGLLGFTKALYWVFLIGTIVSLFIVFGKIHNRVSFYFLVGYVFLTFFMLAYIPVVTVVNLRTFKWVDIRKRIFKFVALLIGFGCLNYSFDFVFRSGETTLLRVFSKSVGLAFGLAFIDVIFSKKDRSRK